MPSREQKYRKFGSVQELYYKKVVAPYNGLIILFTKFKL